MKKIRILLAEDNDIAAIAITFMLEQEGCEVDRAVNSKTILEKYPLHHYDFILMNTMLSQEDTLEVTRKIRQAEATLNGKLIPIIGIYSDMYSEEKYPYQKYFRAGMNEVYAQPLTDQNIHSIFEKYLC